MKQNFADIDLFSEDLPVWENLLGYLRNMPEIAALEVGCFDGRRTAWLLGSLLTHNTARLTCIDDFAVRSHLQDMFRKLETDTPDEAEREKVFSERLKTVKSGAKPELTKSDPIPTLKTLQEGSFDLIVIDGLVPTREMLEYAVLAFDLLKVNGVMVMDGYRQKYFRDEPLKHPSTGIDSFLEAYDGECVPFWKENQVFIRRSRERSISSPDAIIST